MARWPAITLSTLAGVLTAIEAIQTLPNYKASLIAASLYFLLAVLEYVNYYHVQLQHFDHSEDFKRLMSGNSFRQSHLAKGIAAWQRGKSNVARRAPP